MRLAFAGNPNSGKTTMFNALTGRNERVGNWAGVTVEMKEAPIKKSYAKENDLVAVDLPGAYSMSPFTSEESITSSYVKRENPDVIINIVDATNLSRSLFFLFRLVEGFHCRDFHYTKNSNLCQSMYLNFWHVLHCRSKRNTT